MNSKFYVTEFLLVPIPYISIILNIRAVSILTKKNMKNFYNRDNELELLWRIKERSQEFGQFTLVTGRKGIGKTRLLGNADLFSPTLYFFIEEKGEALLCNDFDLEIRSKLGLMEFKYLKTFEDVFNYLIELAKTRDFTLIVDDFQRLIDINPEIYNEIMDWWGNRGYVKGINLILCGSVSSMSGVSKHGKEPLFDLTTARIHLQAFSISTLKEILSDHHPNYKQYNLLMLYTITGGVAQYVELLVKKRIFSFGFILDAVFAKSSFFLEEGKNVLRAKLEKDYVNYFSILGMIAESGRSHEYMEYMLGVPVEGLVDRLENELGLIEKVRPLFGKPSKRNYRYQIKDNFLYFWFFFVLKNSKYLESG